jgi:hypothetical protein
MLTIASPNPNIVRIKAPINTAATTNMMLLIVILSPPKSTVHLLLLYHTNPVLDRGNRT